ncbi:hypothetical protein DQ244_01530 [Blastococcus sp. TBT05-19]|nr:hypothetical protein DQ244_01530 [Blastococcus sp. TBT05-19]
MGLPLQHHRRRRLDGDRAHRARLRAVPRPAAPAQPAARVPRRARGRVGRVGDRAVHRGAAVSARHVAVARGSDRRGPGGTPQVGESDPLAGRALGAPGTRAQHPRLSG